mmetsp:Transcript_98367/g.317173  ORF Transcript_98367/g.317173 Transcript_98367/m.317173 type:complete len:104 (+) Transcript_98367:163-474(+)
MERTPWPADGHRHKVGADRCQSAADGKSRFKIRAALRRGTKHVGASFASSQLAGQFPPLWIQSIASGKPFSEKLPSGVARLEATDACAVDSYCSPSGDRQKTS